MPKKLTSIRISEDILEKIEVIKDNRDMQRKIQNNHITYSREYLLFEKGYFGELSTADVIEVALLELIQKYDI